MRRLGVLAAALLAVWRPSVGEPIDNVTVGVPSFNAQLAMGFNYDLLRPATGVSFQYPVGYIGFNIPVGYSAGLDDFLDDKTVDEIFSDGKVFRKGDRFKPSAGAEQNANYSIRVDVPMLFGVGTFAYTQNFFMNFSTALGGSSVINTLQPVDAVLSDGGKVDGFISMRGALRLPLTFSMGWETMTFGYAYKVGKGDDLVFALNMHRHLFSADIRLKADIDLLGYAKVDVKGTMIDGEMRTLPVVDDYLMDFSSDKCHGFAQGRFSAEGWSPSVGVKWKRFALNSRFGLSVKTTGSANGGFVVPQVVNLETGELVLGDRFKSFSDSMSTNPVSMIDNMGDIIPKTIDSVTYKIESFLWKMPQGHTLSFDIIPQRLTVSYTKIFGEVALEMDVIREVSEEVRKADAESHAKDGETHWTDPIYNKQKVDVGVLVDNILVLSVTYPSFFANVGFGGFDIRSKGTYVLGESNSLKSLRVGDVVMLLPILSGGFNLGTKLQLRVEADILPLPAVRSGVNYYF